MDLSAKAEAKEFLKRLERFLKSGLPPWKEMGEDVEAVVKQAKASGGPKHLNFPEAVVLNKYITPLIGTFLRQSVGLADKDARQALLSESWKALPSLASGSPSRSAKHPFWKVIGIKPKKVVEKWKSKSGLTQSCPDLALRKPAPHRIVFEAKYFRGGGLPRAQAELATGVYEAFFYRGLPTAEKKPHPSWGYDYACLIICDVSQNKAVVDGWKEFNAEVRNACWEAANIYVMVLRGPEATAPI